MHAFNNHTQPCSLSTYKLIPPLLPLPYLLPSPSSPTDSTTDTDVPSPPPPSPYNYVIKTGKGSRY